MQRDLQYLAQLETYNSGKTLKDSIMDMYGSIFTLRYYAGWADKIHGQTIPAGRLFPTKLYIDAYIILHDVYVYYLDGNIFVVTRKEPVGVCGQIIPWVFIIWFLCNIL